MSDAEIEVLDEDNYPKWTHHEDGSVTIHLPKNWALNLADDMNDWESISNWLDREDCKNWKRSPLARENRRESIVYGNCAASITCILGRREMRALMKRAQETRKDHSITPP